DSPIDALALRGPLPLETVRVWLAQATEPKHHELVPQSPATNRGLFGDHLKHREGSSECVHEFRDPGPAWSTGEVDHSPARYAAQRNTFRRLCFEPKLSPVQCLPFSGRSLAAPVCFSSQLRRRTPTSRSPKAGHVSPPLRGRPVDLHCRQLI